MLEAARLPGSDTSALEQRIRRICKLSVLPNSCGKNNQKIIYTGKAPPERGALGVADGTGRWGQTQEFCFIK